MGTPPDPEQTDAPNTEATPTPASSDREPTSAPLRPASPSGPLPLITADETGPFAATPSGRVSVDVSLSEDEREAPAEDPEIVGRLQWMMFFRVVMITVLLGSTLVVNARDISVFSQPDTLTLIGLIVGTYVLTIIYAVLLRRLQRHTAFAYAQLVGDLVTTTVLVLLTGGTESVFFFMYWLTVMNGAILLYRAGALTTATLSTLLVVLIVLREALGVGTGRPPVEGPAARSLFLGGLANVSAVYLVAFVSSYLTEQLRDAGRKLRFASEDIAQLRALNEHIITSIQSGLMSFALDGRVIFFNPAAERITGKTTDEVLFEHVNTVFPDFDEHDRTSLGELGERWEAAYVRPDGERRTIGFSLSPLVDSAGVQRGSILIFQDLTPMRQMAETIRRSEKFAAIGKMAAGLAHEIRNPLASITGSIEMLNTTQTLDEDDRRLMTIVIREIDRLNGLVTDFLNFARPRPPEKVGLEVDTLLQEVAQVFSYLRYQPQQKAVHDTGLDLVPGVWVEGDARQLKQVFWNLMNNAAEAMPDGGRIEIGMRVHEAERTVEITLSDHGVGIPAENLDHIFDPFYTTKERGTGLGLSLVHRIVEDHGGSMWVESEPDLGSTFVVSLVLDRIAPRASVPMELDDTEPSGPATLNEAPAATWPA